MLVYPLSCLMINELIFNLAPNTKAEPILYLISTAQTQLFEAHHNPTPKLAKVHWKNKNIKTAEG